MELPKLLIYSVAIYIFALLYGMNFIISSIGFGIFAWDLLLIMFIILLPLLFFVLYFERSHIEALYGRGPLMLKLMFLTTLIAAVFVTFFIIPISY
jgi:hypothetical protein